MKTTINEIITTDEKVTGGVCYEKCDYVYQQYLTVLFSSEEVSFAKQYSF